MEPNELHPTEGFLRVPRYPRTGTVVSVRMDQPYAQALLRVAREQRRTVSDVAREAIITYLETLPARTPIYRQNETRGAAQVRQERQGWSDRTETRAPSFITTLVKVPALS